MKKIKLAKRTISLCKYTIIYQIPCYWRFRLSLIFTDCNPFCNESPLCCYPRAPPGQRTLKSSIGITKFISFWKPTTLIHVKITEREFSIANQIHRILSQLMKNFKLCHIHLLNKWELKSMFDQMTWGICSQKNKSSLQSDHF